MKSQHQLHHSSKLSLVFLLSLLCFSGCNRNATPPPSVPRVPIVTLQDQAKIFPRAARLEIVQRAYKLRSLAKAHVAVLTIKSLQSTEPSGFGDDVFAAAPFFGVVFGAKMKNAGWADSVRSEWSKRGILICAVAKPKLIIVRVGTNFRGLLHDTELHTLLETNVYPLLLKNQLQAGTIAALRAVDQKIQRNVQSLQPPSEFRSGVNKTLLELRNYSFPNWDIYYYIALKPLLNSLVLTMKLTGFSVWGVLLWLFVLHYITKRDWLKNLCFAFNFGFWKRTGLLKWWLLLGQGQRNEVKEIGTFRNSDTGKPFFAISAYPSHTPVTVKRFNLIYTISQRISNLESYVLKLGLGLPVWASLSLVTVPYWENILTLRNHVAGWILSDLPTHELFVLQNGILWWDKPMAPAGVLFALLFAIFYAANTLPSVALDVEIMSMSLEDAKKAGVTTAHYVFCKFKENHFQQFYYATLTSLVLLPMAVSVVPFILALYLLLATAVEALSTVNDYFKTRRRMAQLSSAAT